MQIRKYKNYKDPRNFRLFLVGVSLFSLTIGVFTASTIAWFDISNNLVVNDLAIGMNDTKGLKIGFSDTGTFYSEIDKDILEANTDYREDSALSPVTSAYSSSWLNEDTVFKDTMPVLHVGPIGSDVATSGFYQFVFYLVSSEDGYIYLDRKTSIKANQSANEETAARFGLKKSDLNQIEGCSRISFYTEDYGYKIFEPNVDVPSKTYLGGKIDYAPFDGFFDFDPGSNTENLYGEYNKEDNPEIYYGLALPEDTLYDGVVDCFHSGTKAGIRPLDIERSIEKGGLKLAQEKTYSWRDLEPPTDVAGVGNPITYCVMGEPKKVVVTVYVEGWDFDTVGSIIQSSMNMNIVLTAKYMPKVD